MNVIFLGLVIWNGIFLVATVATGMTGLRVWHFGLGVFTGVLTCLTHSLVFIQLIGSGKGVKEAVESYSLEDDPQTGFVARTKDFKKRAFPWAMYMPMLIISAAWLGAWHDTNSFAAPAMRPLSHQWHMWVAWIAVLVNFYAFWKEYGVIAENARLIHDLNAVIQSKHSPSPHETKPKETSH